MQVSGKNQLVAWMIWFSATLFYAYEFYIRVTPTVMFPDLIRDFHINTAELGILSAAYYYAYASMQIPVGLLFDRYGIRLLLIMAALIVSMSCILMAITSNVWIATIARILMGMGSAFSFIGCLKLARNWFSKKYLSIIIGLTNSFGIVGAIGSSMPLAYLLSKMSWRDTLILSGGLGLGLVILLQLIIKDVPDKNKENTESAHVLSVINEILTHPKTLLTALYGGLLVAPIAAFTELFSVQFLIDTHHMNRLMAANLSSFTFIGIGFGGPFFGALAAWIGKRRPIMYFGTVLAMLSFACLIYLPNLNDFIIMILMFYFGFFTSHMLLVFAINTERHPPWAAATVIGVTNMVVMIGGTIFQPLIGWLFDQASAIKLAESQQFSHYGMVFAVLIVCQCAALFLIPHIVDEQ